jgi:hypothetical protein
MWNYVGPWGGKETGKGSLESGSGGGKERRSG